MNTSQQIVGAPVNRVDGPQKVTGHAPYAYEQLTDNVAYAFPVLSGIASGRIVSFENRGGTHADRRIGRAHL